MAFRIAGAMAFKAAARKAAPVLLEPVMAVEVAAPEEQLGIIFQSINARRGRIEGVERAAGSLLIKAVAPLAEMLGYGREIRVSTQGRAHHTMRFVRYEAAPRRDEPGGDGAGVTANKPIRPSGGIGFAAARFDLEPE